jgi:exonuclease III
MGHKLIFSGSGLNRDHHGVAIWSHKQYASALSHFEAVNSRITTATFHAKPHDLTIVQCYAPTQDKDQQETDEFYELLAETVKKYQRGTSW